MPTQRVPAPPFSPVSPGVLVLLVLTLAIAIIGPFGRIVALATFGLPALRMAFMAGLVVAGATCANRAGLSLSGRGSYWPAIALAAAAAVALMVCVVDGMLFREMIPSVYVHTIETGSLSGRLFYYFLRALQEEIVYRLFAFSAVIFLVSRLLGRSAAEIPLVLFWFAAFAVQMLNVGANAVAIEPISAARLVYDFVRFVLPGAVWGWLYWRYGFAANTTAHVCCQAILQPLLGWIL